MKILVLGLICLASSMVALAQSEKQSFILEEYINAHNIGTNAAFIKFMKNTYSRDLYTKLDLNKQVKFYQQIVSEFGRLNSNIYKTASESSEKLIVYLIKEDESLLNSNINPAEVSVVELDVLADSRYLRRGLGLGALICEDIKLKK